MSHGEDGGDRSPPPGPDYIPFNAGEWSGLTQEQVRIKVEASGYDGGYDAWRRNWWPAKEEFMLRSGFLDIPRVLDPLMEQNRWMDSLEYLGAAFRYHQTEALAVGPAVPVHGHAVWDVRWTHPELYVLTHAQEALELTLAAQGQGGDLTRVSEIWTDLLDVIAETTRTNERLVIRHGKHIRLASSMQLLSTIVNGGYQASLTQLSSERKHTRTAIRDYMSIYLPEASGRLHLPHVVKDPNWVFGEKKDENYRCMVCHEERRGNLHHLRLHLEGPCVGLTPSVQGRVKPAKSRAKKRKRVDDGGPSTTGGDAPPAGGGGGGAAPVVG